MYQEKAMHYKEKKRSKTLAILLAVDVCICICVLLIAWAVFLKEPQAVALAPDVAPSEVEPNQTPLEESPSASSGRDSDENTDKTVNGKSNVNLKFSKEVMVSLTGKTASLYFGSGERSEMDIVMQLVVQDHVLAQTKKLTPGNKVEKLELMEGVSALLSEGIYRGDFILYYYNQDTGELVNFVANIPVTVMVQG